MIGELLVRGVTDTETLKTLEYWEKEIQASQHYSTYLGVQWGYSLGMAVQDGVGGEDVLLHAQDQRPFWEHNFGHRSWWGIAKPSPTKRRYQYVEQILEKMGL
jgi:hypothetical protein